MMIVLRTKVIAQLALISEIVRVLCIKFEYYPEQVYGTSDLQLTSVVEFVIIDYLIP